MATVTLKERGVCANDKGGLQMLDFTVQAIGSLRQSEVGLHRFPRFRAGWFSAIALACVIQASAAFAQKIEGANDALAAINKAITSVSNVLAKRECLTETERANILRYLDGLEVEASDLGASLKDQAAKATKRSGVEISVSSDLLEQIDVLLMLEQRVERFPACDYTPVSVLIGFNIGGHFIKLTGDLRSTERLAATGQATNDFQDSKDPFGVGMVLDYRFAPWSNNIVVAPFVSVDYLNASVNHGFPNGSFLGTTENVAATFGVKIGPQFQNVWLYGIAGVSALNETLKVNFIPVASSTDATVAGGTVGAGFAFQPSFLQKFSRPVSLFAEYQHTWWQDATFTTPAASPFFNYTFKRQDDVVKVGFTVSLSAPPVPAKPSYPVKALPPK